MKRMNTSMTQDGSPYDNAIAERGERDSQEGVAGTGGFREHRTGLGEGGEGRRVVTTGRDRTSL